MFTLDLQLMPSAVVKGKPVALRLGPPARVSYLVIPLSNDSLVLLVMFFIVLNLVVGSDRPGPPRLTLLVVKNPTRL